MYRVVRKFRDLKHDGHVYEVGDVYPAKGHKASKKRLDELATTKNKYGHVYIEEVADDADQPEPAAEKTAAAEE